MQRREEMPGNLRTHAGRKRDFVAEQVQVKVLDAGIDGLIINIARGHRRGRRRTAPFGR